MSIEAQDLREYSKDKLNEYVKEQRAELQKLLQQKHSKKVGPNDIRRVKKSIARAMGVMHENRLIELVEEYKGKKTRYVPKELRPKLNKAKRLALTPLQKSRKSKNLRILACKYPKKIFAYVP